MLWVVASAVCYSLFAVFTKWTLDDLDPTDILFWRFAIAVPVAWAIVLVRWRRGGPSPRQAPVPQFFLAGIVFGLVAWLAFAGLDHLSAALYTVVIYTYPAMVAIGVTILGRRPPARLWIAIGVTLVGIALTVPEVFSSPEADAAGLVLTLLNAALYAAYVIGSSRLIDGRPGAVATDGLVASAWSLTGSLVFALVVVAVVGVRAPSSPDVLAAVVGLAVVSTVVAGMTLFVGLTKLPPATAALIATIEPALTLLWAVLLLDETLTALQIVGAALVIGGVAWSQRTSPVTAVEPG